MRKLIIVDDEGRKTTVPLVRSEVTIGRLDGNTIRLTERNVSRHHARIFRDDGRYFIEDLSRYGTKKNGQKLSETTVFGEGDVIVIGAYRLELAQDAAAALDDGATLPLEPPRSGTADLHQVSGAAPVPDPGGETIPLHVPRSERARGRLVCMTEPFVGSEFVFTAESLVIGTAADCDLIIEHRSIAPHHARFDMAGEGYTIHPIDAGYPVALDGRYNPQTAMRSGAELLLGELKFRYALPGEDVGLLPLDDIDDDLVPGARPAWLVPAAVAGGVVLLLLLGAVVLSGGGDDPEPEPEPTADAPAAPADSTASAAMERGRAHMDGALWNEAIAAFETVPEDSADRELADSLAARARNELGHQQTYESARRAFDEGNYEQTLRSLAEIPTGTYYRSRATDEDLERRAVSAVVDARLAASQAAEDDGDRDEAIRILEEIQPLAPNNATLATRLQQLRTVGDPDARAAAEAAAEEREREREEREERERAEREEREREADIARAREGREAPSRRADTQRVAAAEPEPRVERAAPPEPEPEADRPSARELRQAAARAGVQQDYQEAIRMLEEAREMAPGDAQINLMLFSNYRQVGNRSRAARAIRRYLRQRPDDPRRSEYEEWLAENAPE